MRLPILVMPHQFMLVVSMYVYPYTPRPQKSQRRIRTFGRRAMLWFTYTRSDAVLVYCDRTTTNLICPMPRVSCKYICSCLVYWISLWSIMEIRIRTYARMRSVLPVNSPQASKWALYEKVSLSLFANTGCAHLISGSKVWGQASKFIALVKYVPDAYMYVLVRTTNSWYKCLRSKRTHARFDVRRFHVTVV
jgi:hypothetical protein